VFPEVDFVISTDISMGSKWENEIGKALDSCNFGIICVTPENANEPWLLFEAGALSKVQTVATVIPYCLEFSPAELPSPLSQFQGCAADEEGTRNLIRAINAQSRTLTESHLGMVFEKCWPEFDRKLKDLKANAESEKQDFVLFFGQPSPDGMYPAVFLDGYLEPVKDKDGNSTELGRVKPAKLTDERGNEIRALPKGVRQIVPYQELVSVFRLEREFRRFGRRIEIRLESEYSNHLPDYGCLSVGLGFNKMTSKLANISHLYEIVYTETIPGVSDYTTDDFVITPEGGGRIEPRAKVTGEGVEWALLARILVNKGAMGPVPYLVCAGHTADGTAAACNFLADKWRSLCSSNRDVLPEKHMAFILTHPKDDRDCEHGTIGPYFRPPKEPLTAR
jgi:hypothetical protein